MATCAGRRRAPLDRLLPLTIPMQCLS